MVNEVGIFILPRGCKLENRVALGAQASENIDFSRSVVQKWCRQHQVSDLAPNNTIMAPDIVSETTICPLLFGV